MAGLAAAWELSRREHREHVESVTVYQRGWRLGGKGASSRGAHGRIEEHGLHVWLGYYDNAFRLIREVYDELDRPVTDPDCPVRTWRDAFLPADLVGVAESGPGGWGTWLARFGRNGLEPGDPATASRPLTAARFAGQAMALLADLRGSLSPISPASEGVFLTASPQPPGMGFGDAVRQAEAAATVAAWQMVDVLERSSGIVGSMAPALVAPVAQLGAQLRARIRDDDAGRRLWQFSDLLVTCLRGMAVDGLWSVARYPTIDDQDFRAWLARHGARDDTLTSPMVNAMYDLVFAYENGDPARPAFAAGLGLFLATKLFFEYKGSIFWKMAAGMGDIVFAPLYQALRARGVRFEFFSRVHALRPGSDGRIEAIEIGRQAQLVQPEAGYHPLRRVRGLPCFPSTPDGAQLEGEPPRDAERHDADRRGERLVTLQSGPDFDVAVLAVSVGMLPHIGADVIASSARWQQLVQHVATVPTQAAQLWLTRPETELGWPHPGATVSGWTKPFDTYASMSHLLPMEDWPAERPQGLAYLCSALPDRAGVDEDSVRASVARLLEERIGDLWPAAVGPDGFRWDLLHGGLGAQHVAVATDPSDRYVQSRPGTDRYRLRVDESGFANLMLAGDWTNCGLNAGCIEAAVLSGLQAANAVLGRPLLAGILGSWYPMAAHEPGEEETTS